MKKHLSLVMFAVFTASCFDKQVEDEKEPLGDEDPNIEEGPRHRAGQPCTTCHGENRTDPPIMSIGGTVYVKPGSDEPANGAVVTVIDSRQEERTKTTNDVGNFYWSKEEWDPVYPLSVSVKLGDNPNKEMLTKIGRDAGCGRCHQKAGDTSHARRVYAVEAP